MSLLCLLYSQDKRQSQDKQDNEVRSKYKERTKNLSPGHGYLCYVSCILRTKRKARTMKTQLY